MQTIIKKVNPENPGENLDAIDMGASILIRGGLVAFPTETVYGLGANALDGQAVSNIYRAKGRPSDNPLIVHISDMDHLDNIAKKITPAARKLMQAFWPGPLTIVFEKKDIIPSETSGGLDTVAVRLPKNKIARLLIQRAGIPIAAPSANVSGRPSPTIAAHVEIDLYGRIDMIIDGGSSVLGLESTVVDARGDYPVMLRPGSVTAKMLKDVCGSVSIDPAILSIPEEGFIPRAPGQKYKHYSPKAKLTIFSGAKADIIYKINQIADNEEFDKIGIMCTDATKECYKNGLVISLGDESNPVEIAANLFKTLRDFDRLGVTKIYAEAFSEEQEWFAVMNRMKKAAAYDIVLV